MKKKFSLLFFGSIAGLMSGCSLQEGPGLVTINPLIGDASFIFEFGRQPAEGDDEQLRVKTHLKYAEQLLLQRDVSELDPELQRKRRTILAHLHDYWTAGIFPRNYDRRGRAPCFIDEHGTICAVGYLIEQTAGREAAEAINLNHKYDELLAMNDKAVDEWIASSGLTREECAMIQPTYNWVGRISDRSLSVLYGRTFRIADAHYQTAAVTYARTKGGRGNKHFSGVGLQLDHFGYDDFSAAFKYFRSIKRRGGLMYYYWGISPEVFRFKSETGFNFKPELGLLAGTRASAPFSLILNLAYGYDVPVYNENSFEAGRHDLSAKIGLKANLDHEKFRRNPKIAVNKEEPKKE